MSPLSYFNSNQKIRLGGTEETYNEKRKPIQNKYMFYRILKIYKSEIFRLFIYKVIPINTSTVSRAYLFPFKAINMSRKHKL